MRLCLLWLCEMDSRAVRLALWPLCMLLCIVAVSGDLYFNNGYLEYNTVKDITAVKNTITVSFRTVEPMGLLLHGSSSGGSASDFVTLELIGGKLRYAARLGGHDGKFDDHEVYLGEDLSDGKSHTIKVERVKKDVTITLDPQVRDPIVREEKSTYANLDLDRYIFTGGAVGLRLLEGVESDSNFMGCIMEAKFVYTDPDNKRYDIDLLTESKKVPENMGDCPKEEYNPFSFPGEGSKLVANTGSPDKMVGSFKFRTYKKDGILLKQKKFEISYQSTAVQLIVESQPVSVNLNSQINEGSWVSVEFEVSAASFKLTVNGQPNNLDGKALGSDFFDLTTQFGSGFIGCMRDIVINSKKINAADVPVSDRPKVVLDKCAIHDFCHPNPCLNHGTCEQDGVTFTCKCDVDSGYKGTICQFPVYPLNCAELKRKYKNTQNGNHTIDVDGPGPLKPFKAYCYMDDKKWEDCVTKIWSLELNQQVVKYPPATGEPKLSFVRNVKYAPSLEAAKALARNSDNCTQFIEYGCKRSPLLNGGDFYGRWVSADGVHKSYWGGADSKSTACGCYPNCLDRSKTCNCDSLKGTWESDKGNLTETSALPVSQVWFGGVNSDRNKEGNFTVGDLLCRGEINNTATFINQDGMLKIKPWMPPSHGVLSLFFRTPYPTGVLFSNGDLEKEYVQLQIVNSTTMVLNFDVGSGTKSVFVTVSGELNDREWHEVVIYRNPKEFTMRVDDVQGKVILDLSSQRDLNVEGDMYLGSDPKALNGFVGCMRGLTVNGEVIDIQTAANEADPGSSVAGGCGAACHNNKQCRNGGECLDNYDVYECNCTLTPFYGYFCNLDHGAFFDQKSYMKYTYPTIESFSGVDMTVGFKTDKCQGDILRITSKDTDQFILLGFQEKELKLVFNSGVATYETISSSACDGKRHSFAMTRRNMRVAFRFDEGDWKWIDKHNLNKPFASMYQLIVGSTDETFEGCITGVKVQQHPLDKKRAAIQPIDASLYYDSASSEVKAQKARVSVSGLTSISRMKCGPEPVDLPPIPTPRIPRPGTPAPRRATTAPREDDGEGSNTAVIVIVVLILILVIVAVLVAIYWYWARHKGVYHTHEDDENIKSTDPYIDLVPTSKQADDTEKKKEWYI